MKIKGADFKCYLCKSDKISKKFMGIHTPKLLLPGRTLWGPSLSNIPSSLS